jgi:hypothetical protein
MQTIRYCLAIFLFCGALTAFAAHHILAGDQPVVASFSGIKEFGLLKDVTDSGYPFVTLTIEFPERGFAEDFTMNMEEVKSVNAQTLSEAIGKYVSFEYNSDVTNALLDLRWKGESLLQEGEAFEITDNTQIVTGILSNAAEPTTGDIPDELYIKTEEEITYKFPFFITPQIVRANGREVTGYFEERTLNTIIALKVKK